MQKDIIKLKEEVEEDIPRCPYCNSGDVVKYGFQRNRVQMYRCNTCRKIFNQRYGTLFYKRGLDDEEILKMAYLFLTGYPISNMPPLFDTTESTI